MEPESTPSTDSSNSNNKVMYGLVAIAAVILIGAVAYIFVNRTAQTTPQAAQTQETVQPTSVQTEPTAPESTAQESMGQKDATTGVTTFQISAQNFSFSVPEIRVKMGSKVKIVLTNNEGMHNWTIDEFNAKTSTIQAGKSAEVEFIASKKGNFEYYCSVGNHRQQGMVGNLIVE